MGKSRRRTPESVKPKPHALHVPVSRRAEGTPSGVGSRRPAREARARGPRVQGPVAVQQGEDAVLLRERPEAGLVRLLLRQERQQDRKSTRLNSSHLGISYDVFCLKEK